MNKQDLIDRLLDCSQTLQTLAEHLQATEPAAAADETDTPVNDAEVSACDEPAPAEDVTVEAAAEKAAPAAKAEPPKNTNPLAKLLSGFTPPNLNLPGGGNPMQLLNMFGGGLPAIPGGNLPGTLAELHDNPQLMGMLNQVAANPQSLSMIASLTGQDPQHLQAMLQSLNPAAAAPAAETIAPAAEAAAPVIAAATAPTPAPMPAPMPVPSATAHLDNLLAEWHWQPYARVWQS